MEVTKPVAQKKAAQYEGEMKILEAEIKPKTLLLE